VRSPQSLAPKIVPNTAFVDFCLSLMLKFRFVNLEIHFANQFVFALKAMEVPFVNMTQPNSPSKEI
jgi:hypothetical protein